jgi:DNA-binding transcriptional LysR family regulator
MTTSSFELNLKSLECFRGIIQTGSATAAAKQLGLTQPGVSRLLGLLESYVGFDLFYRDKGRLVPTEEALVLYQEVDIALASIDRVSKLAKNIHHDEAGELSIVAPPSFSEGLLAGILTEFIQQHPKIRVNLDSQSVNTAKEMVALRSVDCGFVKLPAKHPSIICERLVSSDTVCALPASHPLTQKKTIKVQDLENEPLILLGKSQQSRRVIDDIFRESAITPTVKIDTHTVGAACAFVKGNVGVAIVNEILATQYSDEKIAFRKFKPNWKHEYAFMTSAHAPMTRITTKFLEHCKHYFSNNTFSP